MKIEQKGNGSTVRSILTAMIVDKNALARISPKWDTERGRFDSSFANVVGNWCVEYFEEYGKAPGKSIGDLYESWAEDTRDKDTAKIVERFLGELSGEYSRRARESNTEFVVDTAEKYFNLVEFDRTIEAAKGLRDAGKLSKAIRRLRKFDEVGISGEEGVDVLQDMAAMEQAFESKSEPIIKYHGALKHFFGDSLERDGFVCFMGPEKRGKTFWLIDVAWRAMQQGNKVLFFEVGDLSKNQMMIRFGVRVSNRPFKPRTIRFPSYLEANPGDEIAQVEFKEKTFTKYLNMRTASKACAKVIAKYGMEEPLLKLYTYPNNSIGATGIHAVIRNLERKGWKPDVVVIDYMDLLAPPAGYSESRDQINANWKAMRGISQEYHCLVVSATQTNAASYKAHSIDRSNFSEDKRKLAHVTGMIGINQTNEEKEQGLQRLGWVVLREDEFFEENHVHVAGCLALANPAIRSIIAR